ncbi:MAG: hypothetical protein K0M56_02050 [Kaistella sp.]|nr:hypothetical protein [Kaistella sp.]
MKNLTSLSRKLVLPLILLSLAFSCGTREDELSNEQYLGTWNWVSTDGGIGNIHETPANTGIERKMTFTAENHYTITENSTVVNEGTYNLIREVTSTDHSEKIFIDFSNYPDVMVNSINGPDLHLADDAVDGYTYHYSK